MIVYSYYVLDVIHKGHLLMMKNAKAMAGYDGKLIVGILTDEATMEKKPKPIIPFEERMAMVEALRCVDQVVKVTHRDCTPMLNKLSKQGLKIKYLFHAGWDPEKDADLKRSKETIERLGGKLVQPKYYEGVSTSAIIARIIERKTDLEHAIDRRMEG